MTKIYLTRHGQTEWNLEGRMQGRKDSNLTELGREQARLLGEHLREIPFTAAITSSSKRAKDTADIICRPHSIPIHENELLQEIALGDWEGKVKDELESDEAFQRYWTHPHLHKPERGESFEQVIERAGAEVESIAKNFHGGVVLVVTHAVVLKALLAYFHKKDLVDFWSGAFMHSTSLTVVEKSDDGWVVHMEGDTAHLPDDASL